MRVSKGETEDAKDRVNQVDKDKNWASQARQMRGWHEGILERVVHLLCRLASRRRDTSVITGDRWMRFVVWSYHGVHASHQRRIALHLRKKHLHAWGGFGALAEQGVAHPCSGNLGESPAVLYLSVSPRYLYLANAQSRLCLSPLLDIYFGTVALV